MVQNVTYQNRIHQEENTPLVTILETRVDAKQSTAIDSRKAAYVIDLTKAAFGGIVYPVPGTQWYLKKISGVWALMARAPQQNPQLGNALTPAVGQTYIGNEGDTHIVGNLVVGGTVTSAGSGTPDADIGAILAWTTATPPTGHLMCDGSAVSRTTYSLLFAKIGTTYGVGDGSTTFNLPNLIGRAIVGFDSGQTEFNTLGMTGGEKAHTLTSSELAGHTHGVSAISMGVQSNNHGHSGSSLTTGTESATHTHTIGADNDTASGSFGYSVHRGAGSGAVQSNVSTTESATHTHTISGSTGSQDTNHNHALSGNTDSTGSGTAHNNLQPYIVLYFIIKALSTGSGGGGGGGSDTDSLAGLTDVTITSPALNQVLTWNGSMWVNAAPTGGGGGALSTLSDVTITSIAASQFLQYNGTKWVNVQDVQISRTSTGQDALLAGLFTDPNARFGINADGKTQWGPGSAVFDTNLYRTAAGVLATDGSLNLTLNTAQVNIGGSASTASFAAALPTATSDYGFTTMVTADAVRRFRIRTDGYLDWADGTNAADLNLYRSAAGVLKTDNALTVGGTFTVGTVTINPATPTAGRVLRANGTGFVSAALAESDITNLSTDLAALQSRSTLTTKGDLYVATASATTTRQGVGSNGTVLYADSTQANGMKWQALGESDITNLVTDLASKQALSTVTTKGDLYVATASATTTRVGVGTNGQFFTADSTQTAGVKWTSMQAASAVGCRVYLSAGQSIANNSWTSLNWDHVEFDTTGSSMWASSPNPGRITVPQDGYYIVNASIGFAFNTTGCRGIRFEKNGTPIQGGHVIFPTTTTNSNLPEPSASVIIKCVANDFISVDALQDSGGALSTYTASSNFYPTFSVMLINTTLANLDSVSDVAIQTGLWLPSANGSSASTPTNAVLNITGDIDLRACVHVQTENTNDYKVFISKNDGASGISYEFGLANTGKPYLYWTTGGSNATSQYQESTVAPTDPQGTTMSFRATLKANNGASGYTVNFYTSTNTDLTAATWTSLGTAVTVSGVTSIFSSSTALSVGQASYNFGEWMGYVLAAQVLNGIAGTVVANPIFTAQSSGATSFTDSAGRVWTIGGNATINKTIAGDYLRFDGTNWVNEHSIMLTAGAPYATTVYSSKVIGDPHARFGMTANGSLYWSDGTGNVDTQLYRGGANTLVTDGNEFRVYRANLTDTTYRQQLSADAASRWYMQASGVMTWGDGTGTLDTNLYRASAALLATDVDLAINVAGKGLRVKEGTNAKMGVSTLAAGTVVVSNTSVTANSRIFLTCNTPGGTPGFLRVSARTAGTSFTILSSSGSDTSVVAWQIFEPA